ncbi:TEP1 isoform 9, partial [Pongo abelii]
RLERMARFRCGQGLWVGPVGSWVPFLSLLLSPWHSAQMVIRWLLDIERMALGSTKSLQVPRGLRVRHWMWQCPPWPG